MKKKYYCNNCNKYVDININSIEDFKSAVCPDCGKVTTSSSAKTNYEAETASNNLIITIFNIVRSLYVIFAILGIVFYYTSNITLLYVFSGLALITYYIFRLLDISYLRYITFILIASVFVCVYIYSNLYEAIALGVCYGFLVGAIIRMIRIFVFSFIIKILTKF